MSGLHDKVTPAEGVPFFTPKQVLIAGSAADPQPDNKAIPTLFKPLKIKNVTLQNRIGVSPMCLYSADEKFESTIWHQVHYGAYLNYGPGLTIVEASAVSPEGPLSPYDLGIFNDAQAEKLKTIVDYAHSQRQNIAIQIAHGGRKSSGAPPFEHLERAASPNGWAGKTVAPSAIPYRLGGSLPTPKELSVEEIKRVVKDWGAAAKRAVEISGFDVIEIHAAHGYLINEFYSGISNKRTDLYGGSFENRVRFALEVVDEVKANIPKDVPLFFRLSSTDMAEEGKEGAWTLEDSVKLSNLVVERGVDVIDVSNGGNYSDSQARGVAEAMHAGFAREIKKLLGSKALVACVGGLYTAALSNRLIDEGAFDIALVGRGFLRNPALVVEWANELGVRIWNARQVEWAFYTDKSQVVKAIEDAHKKVAELHLKE
jgi:2,4-dienoyl-CoA reductase-like NADH-dependent reductase (Old Yellow Enzyme family)